MENKIVPIETEIGRIQRALADIEEELEKHRGHIERKESVAQGYAEELLRLLHVREAADQCFVSLHVSRRDDLIELLRDCE